MASRLKDKEVIILIKLMLDENNDILLKHISDALNHQAENIKTGEGKVVWRTLEEDVEISKRH